MKIGFEPPGMRSGTECQQCNAHTQQFCFIFPMSFKVLFTLVGYVFRMFTLDNVIMLGDVYSVNVGGGRSFPHKNLYTHIMVVSARVTRQTKQWL